MSAAGALRPSLWRSFPVDLGWRNFVFALRTALAGISALAIAYWLDLQDPQWAIVTSILLVQPTAGGAIAKGVYRSIGTLAGALFGLLVVALYSQAGPPLVGAIALWIGVCFYAAARLRNFTAYGFMLAAYTALLVGFEGAVNPTSAWLIAVDRTSEIAIGIATATAASVLILPRYAGDVLRASLATTFTGLATYAAAALRPSTTIEDFISLRRRMVEDVVKFDALRSYTMFEARDMRADDIALRLVVRDFLAVLAVVRGLHFRLDDFRHQGADVVLARLQPTIEIVVAALERVAADKSALEHTHQIRAELNGARAALDEAAADLEAMAGTVPLEPLANALLVVSRAHDMLRGLSLVMVTEAASVTSDGRRPRRLRPHEQAPPDRREAFLQGLRASLSLLLITGFWALTGWPQGFSAVSGLAVILFVVVNQDDAGRIGWPYLAAVGTAFVCAYLAMAYVLPLFEGFEALGLFLLTVLVPAGLVAGTPRFTMIGLGFGAFFAAELGTGNVFAPNALSYVNNTFAMLSGMTVCMLVIWLVPVNSSGARQRAWNRMMRELLPQAARGERQERGIASEVLRMLQTLLPRLALGKDGDEILLRGSLGVASTSLELGRLHAGITDPHMPLAGSQAIAAGLEQFAGAFATLPEEPAQREASITRAQEAVERMRDTLEALVITPGTSSARTVVRAAASLRFIADRFGIDRPFLTRSFVEE